MNFKIISILVVVGLVTFAVVKRETIMQFVNPTEAYTPAYTTNEEDVHEQHKPEVHKHDENCDHEKTPREEQVHEEQKNLRHEIGEEEKHPYYQGEVISVKHGSGYTYIEIKEKTDLTFWVVLERVDVKIGDYVRFQKQMIAKNFKSKTLNKTFDEIMFASNIEFKLKE